MLSLLTLLAYVRPLLVRYAYQNKWPVHRWFFLELKPLLQNLNAKEQAILYKRISKYIINIQHVFSWMVVLRGERLNNSEKKVALYLSGFIPMYDDFNDDEGLNHTQIMGILKKQKAQCSPKEALFIFFYEQAIIHYAHPELFWEYLEKAGASQDESLQQIESSLNAEELLEVTTKKGGYSLLFLRGAMHHSMLNQEQEAVFMLGQLIQFMDDIFDMHKDMKAAISTVPNTSNDILSLRSLFYSCYAATRNYFKQVNYSSKQKLKFDKQLSFFIAPAFVCLDQFNLLQQSNGGVFDVKKFSREQLICDMEKPANIRRSLSYYWKGIQG